MHPRTQELLDHLETQHATLRAAVDGVPADRRDRRPAPDRWSVAEVLGHLALVEQRVQHLFVKNAATAVAAGPVAERATSPILPSVPETAIVDRGARRNAPEATLPPAGVDAATAWNTLETARRSTNTVLMKYDGVSLDQMTAPHAAFGTLNMYQWIAFLGFHQARHAAQVREIGDALQN